MKLTLQIAAGILLAAAVVAALVYGPYLLEARERRGKLEARITRMSELGYLSDVKCAAVLTDAEITVDDRFFMVDRSVQEGTAEAVAARCGTTIVRVRDSRGIAAGEYTVGVGFTGEDFPPR